MLGLVTKTTHPIRHICSASVFPDSLGESSLEKLRKTCQLAPVAANIPSLVEVLPYLEVTSHQDYLVRCFNRKCIGLLQK